MAKKQRRTQDTQSKKPENKPEPARVIPRMETEHCPKCGSIRRRVLATRGNLSYRRCKMCQTDYSVEGN